MSAQRLIAEFDRLAEAPGAILRLRRLVLDLAVRGKLAGQDATDEPAAQLVERIQKRMADSTRQGKGRKAKPVPAVGEDEAAFELPPGWKWVRVREVTSGRGQGIPDKEFSYIDVSSIDKEVGRLGDFKVTAPAEAPSRARKVVEKSDVIYACVRPTLLNVAIVDREIFPRPIVSTAFAVLNGFGLVHPKYLWVVLRSPYLVGVVEAKMRGQAYPAINDAEFALLPIPLPPLAEQRRIVAKVDELMALCDCLEAAQAERGRRRDRFAAATLGRIRKTPSPMDANLVLANLERMSPTIASVDRLRQTLIDMAIRGALTSQNSDSADADALLGEISRKKRSLLDRRLMPREKELPPVKDDEVPFAIPSTWRWVRVQEIACGITDGVHKKPDYVSHGVPFLTVRDLTAGPGISFDNCRYIAQADHEEFTKRTKPGRGDILITKDGTIGVTRVIDTDREFSIFVSVAVVKMVEPKLASFISTALGSEALTSTIVPKGAALKHLHLVDLRKLPVPLPPLEEQVRIVSKLKDVMALCDRLENAIKYRDNMGEKLLNSVIRDAVEHVK